MDFGILGPLAAWDGERELRLGGAKQRSVLAVLLLRPNELVPTARLVDELWGERPPATAVKAVQIQVSQLRKLLGEGVLETRPTGYMLGLGESALDAQRFEDLLERGRQLLAEGGAEEAGGVLRDGLALWRGPALADFRYEPFARNEIGRLEELRLVALEHRLEADLALGRAREIVGELEAFVRDQPLREGLCGLLMLALYRSGRQADALVVYQNARARLVEELGLDPGDALQRLEKAILTHDPALDPTQPTVIVERPGPRASAAPKPPIRPAPVGPELVGREEECARLDEVLEDARASRSRAFAIRGEAGVGKSSLLAYATARAGDFVVLRSVGFESDSELAFSGLHQLLRPLLDRLDELPAHQARSLGAALGLAAREDADRMTIGVATLALLAVAAEDADLLVAVDDAQWLDSASMDAILFAARRFEADRVAVILTVREDGTDFSTSGFEELRLQGLGLEATRALLASQSPVELAPDVADRLYELTSGNPLALVELPRVLSVAQLDGHEPFEQPLNLGTRVERAFRGRMEALGPDAQKALLIASASESDGLDTIAAALAEAGVSSSALQDAEDSGLISLVAQSLLFRHPLARSAVYHAAAPSERRAAHAVLARALGATGDVERRAWHLASAALGPDEEVADALESAASAARERVGYAGASRAYERAARLSTAEEQRLRRLLAAADAAWLAGQTARAVTLLEEGLDACRDSVMKGRLLNLRGHIERHTARPGRAFEMLTEAAELLDGVSPLEAAAARIGAWRCCVLLGHGGFECAQTLSERAERDGGMQEFFASLALGSELRGRDSEEARMLLERAEALADEKGNVIFAQSPQYVSLAGMPSEHLGNIETGLRICGWAVVWARERGLYGALPVALMRKGALERRLDQWNAAYASSSESAAIALEQGLEHFELNSTVYVAWFEARRGDEVACLAHLARARELGRRLRTEIDVIGIGTAGDLDLGLGRVEEAIAGYEALVLPPEPALFRPAREYIPDLIEAYVMVGRSDDAENLIEPFAQRVEAVPSRLDEARLARCKGLVADDELFEGHFNDALARHEEAIGGFEEARTRLCFGERLRRVRRRRDAREQLRPALELFERFGAAPWAERTRAELRATGERLRARGPEHEDLTGQELRIALQAAEGKTNRQIGATMFLSPKTIEFHLGRAYRKLGIGSRAELIRHFAAQTALPQRPGDAQ